MKRARGRMLGVVWMTVAACDLGSLGEGGSSGPDADASNDGADANAEGDASSGEFESSDASGGGLPTGSSSGGNPQTGDGGESDGSDGPGTSGDATSGSASTTQGRDSESSGMHGSSRGDETSSGGQESTAASSESTSGSTSTTSGSTESTGGPPPIDLDDGPPAGNPDGHCVVPADAQLEDVTHPTTVVGSGSPQSCTGDAFIAAVAEGGVITFDCGPEPVVITLDRPAKVFNDTGPEIVIDGGGRVTLSGGGTTRILYMNTCDEAQHWTTSSCQNQDHPRLTLQNLTFVDGNSRDETEYDGGGAVWVRGGRFKVINSRFFNNECADVGQDLGGAALRVLSQYQGLPVYVVNSTFGGDEGYGNQCSNGGGISSIGVSWSIYNSVFSHNRAVGSGGNPAATGTPGGGSGGAIYNDGNTMTLDLCGTSIHDNEVNAYGSAIFFVSNDHSGDIAIRDSVITDNVGGSWYPTYPQISNHDDTPIVVANSIIE